MTDEMTPPTNPEEGATLLQHLRLAIAKARSNSLELVGKEVTRMLTPEVMPDSMLNGALTRLDGRTPTWNTLNNVLILAHKCHLIVVGYFAFWNEELPEPYSFPMYEGGDG